MCCKIMLSLWQNNILMLGYAKIFHVDTHAVCIG